VDRRIGIAIGENKIKAIIGAARAGLTNELITDVDTAVKILKQVE
jgi:DNA-binding transcriptional regulator LsrR (DeoR family)